MGKSRLILYPAFAATYSVLVLADSNAEAIPGLWVLTRPVGICLLLSLCAWLLLGLFSRDQDRRAFLTFMIVILFASYGYIATALEGFPWAAPYAHSIVPLLFVVLYLAVITQLLFRMIPDLRVVTHFLTIFTTILIGWATVNTLRRVPGDFSATGQASQSHAQWMSSASNNKPGPDIYLIVLDKYTGSTSLKANFGFDNADFENFLLNHNFIIPRAAQANYISTALSLASLLNYMYLDDLPAEMDQISRKAYVDKLVEDNAVWRFLQAHDYRFIFFPTAYLVTGRNRFADVQIPRPRQVLSEFELVWWRTTLANEVVSWLCRRVHCSTALISFNQESTKRFEWKFQKLSELPRLARTGQPLFVFAHITIPHEPYIFNADCSSRQALWPSSNVLGDQTPDKDAYLAQITCLNQRLKSIVERLLRNSPRRPVILLQGDHGHGRMPLRIPEITAVTPDRIAERAHVFAAYYLPGVDHHVVHDSISSVNVFRTVFREYFQADCPNLPDKTYWSSGAKPFEFTSVLPRSEPD